MAWRSIQNNIKTRDTTEMLNYPLFLGGLSTTNAGLKQYDPFKNGYARIFFITMPRFMEELSMEKTKNFRHLLEYGFTKISGIGNTTLDTEEITGGYAGRSFDVGTVAKDETKNITITLYEFSGSPVREYVDTWITGISDPYTGYGHYHGALLQNNTLKHAQFNHTAEAVYVMTDPTGSADGIEYACLLTNMMPKTVNRDHLNYDSGQHQIVQTDIEFTTVKYESPQINSIAKSLITKYNMVADYLDYNSGYTASDVTSYNSLNTNDFSNWKPLTADRLKNNG